MRTPYIEPKVSFLVLDYQRYDSARLCLSSLRERVKFPIKIIYCHNGEQQYPFSLLENGLIDELIMPKKNGGLGLGTRSLFGSCFSPYAIYWQIDQVMARDFTENELEAMIYSLENQPSREDGRKTVLSISLAGAICGEGIYSERAHIIRTSVYKNLESNLPLSFGGAGPWHDYPWREGQIQEYYKNFGYFHKTDWEPLAIDYGHDAVRENPDGSRWRHEPDTKRLWLLSGPVKDRFVYPKLSPNEWDFVILNQYWPPGQIPEQEEKDSFHVWH